MKGNTSTDETWLQVKQVSRAAARRRRAGAPERAAPARAAAAAQRRASISPPPAISTASPRRRRTDGAAFEAEWSRMGGSLRDSLGTIPAGVLDGVEPAAVRAMGEAALPQIKGYYDASLEYGRNTMAQTGLFYIGSAQAQREFVALCRALSAPSGRPAPPAALPGAGDRAARRRAARRLSPARFDRPALRVHRGERDLERGPRARRRGPALRRDAPVPPGIAPRGPAPAAGKAPGCSSGPGAPAGAPRAPRRGPVRQLDRPALGRIRRSRARGRRVEAAPTRRPRSQATSFRATSPRSGPEGPRRRGPLRR